MSRSGTSPGRAGRGGASAGRRRSASEPSRPAIDLLVAGDVRIRLEGAPGSVVRQLQAELGATPAGDGALTGPPATGGVRGDRDPVLLIRFVERLPVQGSLRLAGLTGGAFGWDDRDFYLVGEARRRVRLDLERSDPDDDPAEPDHRRGDLPGVIISAESGIDEIPHLISIVGLLLLERGQVLLHAASLTWHGQGVLIPGWQSAGKSELLLGLMAAGGACYAGDEWTLVGLPGPMMRGLPSHPHLWAWQLAQLSGARAAVPAVELNRLRTLAMARRMIAFASRMGGRRLVGRVARDAGGWLANAERIRLPARQLFDEAVVAGPIAIDQILVPMVGVGTSPEVRPIEVPEVVERMAASLAYERRGLDAVHAQFRHAFPGRRWARLDAAGERERQILGDTLVGVPAREIRHPYPPNLAELAVVASRILG